MPRRCPTCQQWIDDNRLVVCPECRTSLSAPVQAPALSQDQIDRIVDGLSKSGPTLDKLANPVTWRIVKNIHWWIAFPLFWIAALLGSHFTIKGTLEKLMISRIDQEFKEPRIQQTMQGVVNSKASEMLTTEIQPEVSRFKDEVNTKVQNFQVFTDNLKADFQKEYQALSEEVTRLKQRNHLAVLGDRAISGADREALNELIGMDKESESIEVKIAVHAEISRIISYWVFMSRTETGSIYQELDDGTVKKDNEIPTNQLILVIQQDKQWVVRAVAARLLGQRKEKGVPEVLLKTALTDDNLEVVKYAVKSFKSVTDAPVWGFFDFDGLEQWWKEHFAEVNERLE